MNHILAELFPVLEHVMNKSAEECNVAPGAHRQPDVRHRRSSGEPRINVNDRSAALARFDHPLEADRMVLRHRRSHNENGVRVSEVLLSCGRAAASERGSQTGNRRAVSYTCLIAEAHHPQAAGEELFYEIVLFVVERSATEMADRLRLHHRMSIFFFFESGFARFPEPVSDHIHRLLQIERLPFAGIGPAIFHLRLARWAGDQLKAVGAFGTEMSPRDRRLGITLNAD